jgi:hypothetical protein
MSQPSLSASFHPIIIILFALSCHLRPKVDEGVVKTVLLFLEDG